jgi:hypothetical protein
MSFQRRRQLNEEQTRIYAAGMNAARRGDTQPKERLSPEQYKVWCWGWRRVKRPLHTGPITRSSNHLTLVEGMHCIHTEAETLDDALKILAIRQRAKKASQVMLAKPQNWRSELGLHKGRQNSPIGKALTIEQSERITEFERHIVGRVVSAIGELKLGVEEMSVVSAMSGMKFPAVNPKALMDVIGTLSHLIRQDMPNFNIQRTPMQKPIPHCISCGAELSKYELEYCKHCDPATEHQRNAAKLLREHHARLGGVRHEVNELEKLTYKIKRRVIDHDDDQGHSGHPNEITGSVETGGGKEDVVLGSEAPHQPGKGGAGDAEG